MSMLRSALEENERLKQRLRKLEEALQTIHSFAFGDSHGLDDDRLDRIRVIVYKALVQPR